MSSVISLLVISGSLRGSDLHHWRRRWDSWPISSSRFITERLNEINHRLLKKCGSTKRSTSFPLLNWCQFVLVGWPELDWSINLINWRIFGVGWRFWSLSMQYTSGISDSWFETPKSSWKHECYSVCASGLSVVVTIVLNSFANGRPQKTLNRWFHSVPYHEVALKKKTPWSQNGCGILRCKLNSARFCSNIIMFIGSIGVSGIFWRHLQIKRQPLH